MQGVWETDEDDKRFLIDAEDQVLPHDHVFSDWDLLPDLTLGRIFSHLSMREKYWASMTCRNWYRAFHHPESWAVFSLHDYSLTRRKFNYYSGWQHTLDHWRTMQCLTSIGSQIRFFIFEPMMNFYNLYEFMNMVSYYAEQQGRDKFSVEGVGRYVRGLRFYFPCDMRQKMQAEKCRIFGTGGQILDSIKRLMSNLGALTYLELIDLQLEYKDARYLLDDVCFQHCSLLRTLKLVNLTKEIYPLLHPGVFINLRVLVMSPQNLCEDLVRLLGQSSLRHLHIKSTVFSPVMHRVPPIHHKIWQECREENVLLQVHVESVIDVLWQDSAPVASLILTSRKAMVQTDMIVTAIERYADRFRNFCHLGLPYFHRSKSFHDRADSSLLLLCRQSPQLRTLIIRERISTATILLIVSTAKNLERLVVRKNAVIIKTDWPKCPEWTEEFYAWLKINSRSYEAVEREVSQILGYSENKAMFVNKCVISQKFDVSNSNSLFSLKRSSRSRSLSPIKRRNNDTIGIKRSQSFDVSNSMYIIKDGLGSTVDATVLEMIQLLKEPSSFRSTDSLPDKPEEIPIVDEDLFQNNSEEKNQCFSTEKSTTAIGMNQSIGDSNWRRKLWESWDIVGSKICHTKLPPIACLVEGPHVNSNIDYGLKSELKLAQEHCCCVHFCIDEKQGDEPKKVLVRQSKQIPKRLQTRWAHTRICVFEDGSKTYEIMPTTVNQPENVNDQPEGVFAVRGSQKS